MNKKAMSPERRRKAILSVTLAVICVIYVLPVLAVAINSFKLNTFVKTDTFALPTGENMISRMPTEIMVGFSMGSTTEK